MLEQKTYKHRYSNEEQRNTVWRVLSKHFFQKFVSSRDAILDVACGYGWFINNIDAEKKYALDINPDAANYLRENVKFLLGPSTRIELPDNTLDKIYVGNLFEHLTRLDIVDTIKEFHRVLKPSGEVLVLQPNIRFLPHDYWMFFDHITPIDDRALDEVFLLHGFESKSKILKFLPHNSSEKLRPGASLAARMYLALPIVWPLFGKSSFLIYKKRE